MKTKLLLSIILVLFVWELSSQEFSENQFKENISYKSLVGLNPNGFGVHFSPKTKCVLPQDIHSLNIENQKDLFIVNKPAFTSFVELEFKKKSSINKLSYRKGPQQFDVELCRETGEVDLIWEFEKEGSFEYFVIYRNGKRLGVTQNHFFYDTLYKCGDYTYKVEVVFAEGTVSVPVKHNISWNIHKRYCIVME
ncbi:MAG: hypothetical protein ACEPOW_09880 [Bacteroidales bacterium]